MKIKKRLKYKSTLPKADFGMDASNMNMQKASMLGADSDENGGMGAIQGLGMGLNAASGLFNSLMPEQNMNNISKGGQIGGKVAKTAFGVLSQSPEPISKAIGMVGSFVTDPIMQLVAMVRENHKNPLHDQKFEPVHKDVSYSFGEKEHTTPVGGYKFGGFLKHYGNGGEIKYDSNFRPDTEVEQKYNEKTGLWEVGGTKPKKTIPVKQPVEKIGKPIETYDPYDKRLQMYQDSLATYKSYKYAQDFVKNVKDLQYNDKELEEAFNKAKYKFQPGKTQAYSLFTNEGNPIDRTVWTNDGNQRRLIVSDVKKPVQPVILKPFPMAGNINIMDQSWDDEKKFAMGGFLNKNRVENSLSNGMFSPTGKFFSSPEQYQQYQSFYNPQSQFLQQPIMNNFGKMKLKNNNSFFELGGDPRAQSNIEAEEGEAMQHSSGKIEAIGGKKHPQGGTPLKVQPSHEYIYSDSLGRDKNGNITLNEKDVVKSFADEAKSIQKKYSSREGDSIVDKTKEIELGLLKQDAEQARVAKEEIEMGKQMKKYKAKYGMTLKKYANSGFVFNQNDYIDWIKQNPEYTDKDHPIKDLNSITAKSIYRPMYAEHIYNQYGADAYNTVVDEFSKRPGGYTVGKDIDYNITQYDFPSDPTAPKSWANSGGRWTSDNPYKGVGIPGNYGGISEPLGGGINPTPFIGPMMPSSRYPRGGFGPYPQGQIGTPMSRATASQDQRSTSAQVADKIKGGFFGDLTTGDKMQLASMLPAFGFNLGMGLKKYDVEPNRKNQYENDVINIMQNRKFDIQNYLNQANLATNTAKEDIGNNSTSVGGKMANIQKLYANSLNSLGDITTKGQKMNNQYRAEEANTKNILGEANRAEANRASGITDQNKARKQQFLAKAFEQMGQGIAATGQSANQSLTNRLLAKSLSEIAPDFDIKELKDVYKDKDGYIVFRGEKYNYNPERNELMKVGNTITANAAKSQYAPKDFTMNSFANFIKDKTK